MNVIQLSVLITFEIISLGVFIRGCYQVFKKGNPFGEPFVLFWLGIFVWGDAVILGFFWSLMAIICLILNDWLLFWLIVSIFWIVRSGGEVIYWINQQFSPIIRNPPQTLAGYKWFKNDSIWFAYQVVWQCLLVVSVVATIFIANLWVRG